MTAISARKYMMSNARTNLVRVGVSTLTTLVLTPFIIQHIGIANYSYVALTSFFISFSGIFDMGLSKSLVYLLNDSKQDEKHKNQYLTIQSIIVGTLILLIFSVGMWSLLTGTSVLGSSLSSDDSHFVTVTLACFLVLMLTLFDQFQCAVLESFFLLHHVNHGMSIKVVTLNLLFLLNLFVWNNVSFYVFSSVLALSAATGYYTYILHKHVRWCFCKPSGEAVRLMLGQSFHFFRFSILNSLYNALPRLSVMYISADLSSIGILDVIEKLSMSVINLCASILRPLFSLSRQAPQKIARQLTRLMLLNGGIGLLFVGVVVVFNRFITDYFFSRSGVDTSYIGKLLILYAIGSLFLLMGQPLSFYLQGEGKAGRLSWLFMVNILLFVLLYVSMKEGLQMDSLLNLSICYLLISVVYLTNLYRLARTTSHSRLLAY